MANKKISELPYINGGKISGNTIVPLVTYFSAATGDTVHTYISDFQTYLISGLTGNTDVFVTGGTYSAGTITLTNNTGGTFNVTGVTFSGGSSVSGDYLPLSGGTVSGSTLFTNGLSANTISATTYLNLPANTDVFVTGGTYTSGTATFKNNTGGTFTVTGFTTGNTLQQVLVNGNTSNGNDIIMSESDNIIFKYAGFNNNINTEPLSSNRNILFQDKNGTVALLSDIQSFTGGTVSGSTLFTNGLTANTISATTYLNLPLNTDVFVTGGTYSSGTSTFTNNTGGTFNVTGFYTGDTTTLTGVTNVGTGLTIFDSIVDRSINLNTFTGDSLEKITTTLTNNTIEVGINETKLSLWPLVVNGNRLLDGSVSYVSGLTFDISRLNYVIDGSIYKTSSSSQVILDSGDTSFDRIDVIYADINGNTGVLKGTASTNPEKPIVDSNTQVEVTFVSVPTSASTPTINTELIYDEKVGLPTEWNFLRFGNQTFRISGDSTAQSYSGSKSISVSGLTTSGGNYSNGFILSSTTVTDTTQFATLQFAIRNMSGNSTNTYILIQFLGQTGNVLNGSNVWLYGGSPSGQYYSYLPTNTTIWQLISIPLWRFYLTSTNVYGIKFSYLVGSTVARHYIDKIELVEGLSTSPPTNNWVSIKGDSTTTISASAPNSTLTISGGTNISSSVSGTTTVVLNLDNNINLNGITASTISATTYQNLPNNVTGNYLPLSGGTVSGSTLFTTGLTANTLNVGGVDLNITELQNRAIVVTGGTINAENDKVYHSIGAGTTTYNDPTGVEGRGFWVFVESGTSVIGGSSVTINGVLIFRIFRAGSWTTTSLINSGTIANIYVPKTRVINSKQLSSDITLTANDVNALPLSGGTVSGDTVITANLVVSGNSGINWFSSNTSSDLVRITQVGSGNAFVVDDSTNPDVTPFIVTSGGSVTIGTTEPFSTAGSEFAQLNVTKGSSGVAFSGLPSSTTAIFQSNTTQSLAMFAPDANNSQIYFGTPSDSFGSFLRWDYTNRNLILATANSTGKLIFQTANAVEVARIDQNGNMGINTANPQAKLDIVGNFSALTTGTSVNWISANTSTDAFRITQVGSGNAFVVEDNTNPDTSPFVINTSGNTGIGTTTPQTMIELVSNNTADVGNVLRFRNSDTVVPSLTEEFIGKIEFFSNETSGGGTGVKSYIGSIVDSVANSSIIFATTGGTGSLVGTSSTLVGERMRINQLGDVGIGTSLPITKLHVNGNSYVSGTLSATTFSGNTTTISGTKGTTTINGSTTTSFLTFSGSNTVGGTGYTDFIRVTNTASGVTNPSKTFRLNINGELEIIDSTYSTNIFTLSDGGNVTISGRMKSSVNYSQTGGGASVNLSASGSPQTILSTTITTYGNPVMVCAYGDAENSGAGYWSKLQLWRDSTAIGAIVHTEGSAGSENSPFAFTYIDAPVAGTYTYYLKANEISGGSIKFGESTAPILNVREL